MKKFCASFAVSNSIGLFAAGTLIAFASAASSFGCSVCGCSLSADWAAQGYSLSTGFETDLRFEYFDQTQLRSGTHAVDRDSLTFPNDDEVQQRTLNRNLWLDLNYVSGPWSVALQLPYHDRFHTTIAEGDTAISTSQASGLGDVRLLARYQLQRERTSSWSLQFGLKLPTGRFDQTFAEGPQAGELLDRGLQLGTGTTDLLAGAAWFARPATNLGMFAQATLDQPLAAREDFLPSSSFNVSGGVRWLNSSHFTPQLQVNVKFEGREHGAEADVENSGSTVIHLSPGVTAELSSKSTAFVFVQLPVYQRVNGLQLAPHWLLSTGLRWKF
jgi:hypothetical protein